jgi:hypothetical protein
MGGISRDRANGGNAGRKDLDSAENSALADRPRRETIRQYKGMS